MEIASILTMVVPALFPAVIDGFKMLISKLTGVSMGEPKTFQDWLQGEQMKTQRLQALAALDQPSGSISQWVANFRACFRYAFVGLVLIGTLIYAFMPPTIRDPKIMEMLFYLSDCCIFFIIGDRTYMTLKNLKIGG